MLKKNTISVLILFLMAIGSYAQEPILKSRYINPLDIPIRLSGTFCELRLNHFHAGLDIKTQSVEGKVIRTVAEGYISRIVVSTSGYGKALYIAHPDGYTTVYAHLQKFSDKIQEYVVNAQYTRESFEIELFPDKSQLPVNKGDIIALSGNTGGSEGPHLHFEVRETATQIPVDPLSNGFIVKDFIRPTITLLKVYPVGTGAAVNKMQQPTEFFLNGWGPKYRLRDNDTISISGNASFGLMSYDLLNDESNKNGIYASQLFIDSTLVLAYDFARLPFDETRYIHSLCDFAEYQNTGRWIPQTRIQPGNKLSIYRKTTGNGIYNFEENVIYHLKYIIRDYYNNESVLRFIVKGCKPIKSAQGLPDHSVKIFDWNDEGKFETENFRFIAPKGAFYDTVHFYYYTKKAPKAYFSDYHVVHRKTTPIQTACTIMLKPSGLSSQLYDKALIVKINDRGAPVSAGGKYENGWVSTQIKTFGTYSILIDTVCPVIKPMNIFQGKKLQKQKDISVFIKDYLSGIKSYRATLNNRWILMEYDVKEALLTYEIDEKLMSGENLLKITVTDQKGNISELSLKLYY
jgi:murein DD-endopeptidase MepM/ murein hydrolase activator NlpD